MANCQRCEDSDAGPGRVECPDCDGGANYCQHCDVDGQVWVDGDSWTDSGSYEDCPECGGEHWWKCETCDHSGWIDCEACDGTGEAADEDEDEHDNEDEGFETTAQESASVERVPSSQNVAAPNDDSESPSANGSLGTLVAIGIGLALIRIFKAR